MWTAARVEELKRLWNSGRSASKIASILGVSRNAVIGKVHRLNLAGRQTFKPAAARKTPRPVKPRSPALARIPKRPKPKPVRLPPPEPPKPYDGPSVSIMDVKENQCRFIVSGEGVNTMFCGAPIDPDASPKFCEACKETHNLIDKTPVRRRDRDLNYAIKKQVAA